MRKGGTLKDDDSCHLRGWRWTKFELAPTSFLSPNRSRAPVSLVGSLHTYFGWQLKKKNPKEIDEVNPFVPSTLPYSWVALSLAMSAPSIQNSCPTFVSQTFYVPESLGQRVPASGNILIPLPSPRNKSRRWFPILKISHQDIHCAAAAMLFRWLRTQWHWGDEKRLVQFSQKRKTRNCGWFCALITFLYWICLAGDINLEATCSSSVIRVISVSNDWDFFTHNFSLLQSQSSDVVTYALLTN